MDQGAVHMKIEVQGYELMVLIGAECTLREINGRNPGPIRVFEYAENLLRDVGTNPKDLLDYMKGF